MKRKSMNVLVAPNSMKGSLNAFEFADIVEEAFLKCSGFFNVRKVPVADGGDFTGEILKRALEAQKIECTVNNPLGREIKSGYAISGEIAIIEMADASGFKLLKADELNPLIASSFGTGQLINDAIAHGCSEILLGIGGSATVDGGAGMLEALGFQLMDKRGKKLVGNGGNLELIDRIERPEIEKKTTYRIISDVTNPLLGSNGAAAVFGPQKGATKEMVNQLEKGLANWATLLENESGKKLAQQNGAGAAGGIAAPLMAFFDAEIVPGAEFVLNRLNFHDHVQWADIVITGEGRIDSQTLNSKAPMAVANVARKYGKPVFAFGGSIDSAATAPFNGLFSILNKPQTLKESMHSAKVLLAEFSFEFSKTIYSLKKEK